jgi:hypothetical protein
MCSSLQNDDGAWIKCVVATNGIKHVTIHLARRWRYCNLRGEGCIEGKFGSKSIPAQQQLRWNFWGNNEA